MNKIAVLGAGTMGRGIAQAAALAGYEVLLFDIEQGILDGALVEMRASIDKGVVRGKTAATVAARAKTAVSTTSSLTTAAQADLVIEAVPEKLELKRKIFAELDANAPDHTILASNTSSLSIGSIAAATQRPDRVLGLHFFNPAHIMKLVELVRTDETSEETAVSAATFVDRLGKTAVFCQDTPAFIVNRVARPFYSEAFRMLGEGTADIATIDKLIESLGFRMGPFRLIDLIGCDVNLAVTKSVYNAYFQEPKYRPHFIQQRTVESGRLGRKTGRGFYTYE